jgi:hypothetical protein
MFIDSHTSADSDVFDDEQQRSSVQVEHVEKKENDTAENNVEREIERDQES